MKNKRICKMCIRDRGWNGSIFNMIENLSNSIMVPIAGVILAIVMTVDLIQMIADKNNLHDVYRRRSRKSRGLSLSAKADTIL